MPSSSPERPFVPRRFLTGLAWLLVAVTFGIAVPWPVAAQQEALPDSVVSPALAAAAARLMDGEAMAVEDFWRQVQRQGAPLIEPSDVPGWSIVTFVVRGETGVQRVRLDSYLTVLLTGSGFPHPDSTGWMSRLGKTDLWHISFRVRDDLRVPYAYEVHRADLEPERRLDPLNPDLWEPDVRGLRASILELPGTPPQPWRNVSGEEGDGDWDELSTEDEPVRNVYIYKPVAWDRDRTERYPLLIGLGAFGHGIGMRVDRLVDELIAAGRLPPVVVALVDLTREDEPARYASTAAFVLEELLPHLRSRYHVTEDPSEVVLSGTSRRAMVAALLAFEHPDALPNVLSLSGSYYWSPAEEEEPEWVPTRYADADRRPIRFYLAAGALETWVSPTNRGLYLLATNRHMRDVLRARGYPVRYVEFNGGHTELSWADGLAEGLIHFLGR